MTSFFLDTTDRVRVGDHVQILPAHRRQYEGRMVHAGNEMVDFTKTHPVVVGEDMTSFELAMFFGDPNKLLVARAHVEKVKKTGW